MKMSLESSDFTAAAGEMARKEVSNTEQPVRNAESRQRKQG